MRRIFLSIILAASTALAGSPAAPPMSTEILRVKRIYVEILAGDESAQALRELIISSITSTGLFVMTDNPDRADAVLRGAAGDEIFEDIHDSRSSVSTRESGGRYGASGASAVARSAAGGYGGISISDDEGLRTKEHKHQAYATVRLCNRDGDVLWATTQESGGAKFRGASADVAAKVARQLSVAVEVARRSTGVAAVMPDKPAQQSQPGEH